MNFLKGPVQFLDVFQHLDRGDQVESAVRVVQFRDRHLTDGDTPGGRVAIKSFREQRQPVCLDVNRIDAAEAIGKADGINAVAAAYIQQPISRQFSPLSENIEALSYSPLTKST